MRIDDKNVFENLINKKIVLFSIKGLQKKILFTSINNERSHANPSVVQSLEHWTKLCPDVTSIVMIS